MEFFRSANRLRIIAGALLIASGAVLYADNVLRTGWLRLMILPGVGMFLYVWGLRERQPGLLKAGGVVGGVGMGVAAAFTANWGLPFVAASPTANWWVTIGRFTLLLAAGFGLIVLGVRGVTHRTVWWALLTGGILAGVGAGMQTQPVNGVLVIALAVAGTGLPLLLWGLIDRLYGLVIAGCIVATVAPGLWYAWGTPDATNVMVRTGIMLVWFSFGWALITVFSRMMYLQAAWWPLIPGGILAVVGLGLYIGGDPSSALGFIGNTGSIVLMIFGLYLLLMRKGIHRE